MDELTRTRSMLEQLNVGVIRYLEQKKGINKVDLEQRAPADRHAVLMWEQRNTCFLPDDIKNFYLTTDGFYLHWSVKMDNGPMSIGRLHINRISQLARIGGSNTTSHVNPTLQDLETDSDLEDEVSGLEKPTFDSRCKIFELDPCDGYGKVCMVYKENKTGPSCFQNLDFISSKQMSDLMKFGGNDPKVEIWFLDRALRWHFLTESFMAYYRLMFMHLGLPQWQYALTDIGVCQQAKQWFNMFAPTRLELDNEAESVVSEGGDAADKFLSAQLDIAKVFKGKSDKKKPSQSQTQQNAAGLKKKPVVNSAKTAPQPTGNRVTASSSQISNKTTK